MQRDDDAGDALEDMARMRPALDRLRQLLTSATILDLKATAGSYWTDRGEDAEPRGATHQPA